MVKIELFVSGSCPHCPKAHYAVKQAIKDLNVDFEKIRIQKKEGRARAEKYHILGVPCLVIDGKVWKGHIDPDSVRNRIERIMRPKQSILERLSIFSHKRD